MTVVRCRDARDVARQAVERLAALASSGSTAPFAVALSGGATPRVLYETLASPEFAVRVPWDRVELFFGDERPVPPGHPDSNYSMVERALLSRVRVTAHRMQAEAGEDAAYDQLIRRRLPENPDGVPVFDVILLGVGPDGHTASLFPGTSALSESRRLVVMNEVPQKGTRRMTFTYPLINAARHVWILATGAEKQPILAKVFGGRAPDLPVCRIRPRPGELTWWLDDDAAKAVPPQEQP